jgi:YaiO family outer membrane protein
MRADKMKIIRSVMAAAVLAAYGTARPVSGEQLTVEREISKESPILKEVPSGEKIYAHEYYEEAWVKQGSRKGSWRELSTRVAFLHDNIPLPYVDFTQYTRLGVKDYSIDMGGYVKLDKGFFHAGIGYGGFGGDRDYIYRFKFFCELERQIAKGFSVNLNSRYLHYPEGDVFIFIPGLVYYFGDSYLSAQYGVSATEKRDPAQFVIMRGNLKMARYLSAYFGGAVGERLYDIFPQRSSEQFGYTVFGGLDFMLSRNISLRIGGSYSEEGTDFIKRGVESRLAAKF